MFYHFLCGLYEKGNKELKTAKNTRKVKRQLALKELVSVFFWVFFLWFSSVGAYHKEIKVERLSLPNGFRLVLLEEPSRGLVSSQLWIEVGSAYEEESEAGMAHFLEHMLFKPTQKNPEGVASVIESIGGRVNAFTSFDYTVFHFTVKNKGLEKALEALADAVLAPLFDPEELEREREVVIEEIKMGRDDPIKRFRQALWESAFEVHPYGRPIIGFEESIRGMKREDLIRFHSKWYVPQRMVLVVVGDFDRDRLKVQVEKLFGAKEGTSSFRLSTCEGPLKRPKVLVHTGAKREVLSLAFKIPGVLSREALVFDLLGEILAGGRNSRLFKKLVESGLAVSVEARSVTLKDNGLFLIEVIPKRDKQVEVLRTIKEELHEVAGGNLTKAEMERAKKRLETDFLYSFETSEEKASLLGFFEMMLGSADFVQNYLQVLRSVKEEEISKVAKEYLIGGFPVIGLLCPDGQEGVEAQLLNVFSPLVESRLSNGAKLLFSKKEGLPTVAVTLSFPGGTSCEKEEKNGITALLARCLTRGTYTLTASEISSKLERIGGVLEGFFGRDAFGLKGKVLKDNLREFVNLLSEIVTGVSFSQEEVDKAKEEQIEAIKRQKEKLTTYAFQLFRSEFFKGHPYGLNPLGTKESVKRITREDLLEYWRSFAVPERMVISVVGDIEPKTLKRVFEKEFGVNWNAGKGEVCKTFEWTPPQFFKEVEYGKGEQVHIIWGFRAPELLSQDYEVFTLFDALVGGQRGRLFKRIREELGLAYQVSFFYSAGVKGGYCGFYLATSPDKLNLAKESLKGIMKEILSQGIERQEFENAKEYLLGNYEMDLEDPLSFSFAIAMDELSSRGGHYYLIFPERIKRLSPLEFSRRLRSYLDPEGGAWLLLKPNP